MLFSILIGIVSGIIYGLSFILQRRKAFFNFNIHLDRIDEIKFLKKEKLKTFIFSITRIIILMFLFYLLLLVSTNLIIILISFLLTFWLIILKSERII